MMLKKRYDRRYIYEFYNFHGDIQMKRYGDSSVENKRF